MMRSEEAVTNARGLEGGERMALPMNNVTDGSSDDPALRLLERGPPAPLSFSQERLWVMDQLQPGGSEYNTSTQCRLSGELNLDALERSIREIIRRHETLRTRIGVVNGDPVQV